MLRETDPSLPSRKTSLTVQGAAGLLAATLLATGCTSQASGEKDTPVFPQVPVARGDKLPGSVSMSGPASSTDEVALQLQLIRGLHNLVGEEYVTGVAAKRLAEQLRTATDPTTKAVVGRQILKSIATYGFDVGQPLQKLSDVEGFLPGATTEEINRGQQLLTANVYASTLEEISWGQQEPETLTDGEIGDTGVQATDAFLSVAHLVDAADAFSSIYDQESAREAAEDIATVADPEITALATAYVEHETVDDLMGKYSYGGISRVDMESSLAGITNPALIKLARRYMVAVDEDNYKEQYAAKSTLYDLESQLNVRKRALSDRADQETEKIAPPSTTSVDEIQEEQYDILDRLRAELDGKIETFNASLAPDTLKPLSELEDPYQTVDLSGADSRKKITVFGEYEEDDKHYTQIAEAFVDNGTSRLQVEESAVLPHETQAELEKIYADVAPLVEAAMQKQALFNVRFVVDTTYDAASDFDFGAHYDPLEKTIYIILPRNTSVSADMLRQTAIHELTHALIKEAYQGVNVTEEEVDQMKSVCKALSDEARSHFENSVRTSIDMLDRLMEEPTLTPEERAVFKHLRRYIEQGTVNEMGRDYYADIAEDFASGCETPSFDGLLSSAIYDTEKEAETDKKGDTTSTPSQVITVTSLSDKLKENSDYSQLRTAWYEAVYMKSLYERFLNESSRLKTSSAVKEYLGHSEDYLLSGTEVAASLMSGLLGDTQHMKRLYASASEEDKAIMEQTYDAVTKVLAGQYSTLSEAIISAKKQVLGV